MAKMTIAGSIQNTRNNVTDADGYALPPLAANLKEGQIAVNTCETDPCIFFKTSEGKIVKIVSEEKLTKALTDILGNSAADLDTLRELIALFEGSANDILPMLTALTDRVTAAESALSNKVTKETGKGLSTNDYTTQEKTKLSGIESGAQVNTVTSVAGKSGVITLVKADVGLSNVDNTADSAKPVSTSTQTALNGKVDKVSGKGLSTNDFTTAEKTKLSGIETGAQVNNIEVKLGSAHDDIAPIVVDNVLNINSGNPIANKPVAVKFDSIDSNIAQLEQDVSLMRGDVQGIEMSPEIIKPLWDNNASTISFFVSNIDDKTISFFYLSDTASGQGTHFVSDPSNLGINRANITFTDLTFENIVISARPLQHIVIISTDNYSAVYCNSVMIKSWVKKIKLNNPVASVGLSNLIIHSITTFNTVLTQQQIDTLYNQGRCDEVTLGSEWRNSNAINALLTRINSSGIIDSDNRGFIIDINAGVNGGVYKHNKDLKDGEYITVRCQAKLSNTSFTSLSFGLPESGYREISTPISLQPNNQWMDISRTFVVTNGSVCTPTFYVKSDVGSSAHLEVRNIEFIRLTLLNEYLPQYLTQTKWIDNGVSKQDIALTAPTFSYVKPYKDVEFAEGAPTTPPVASGCIRIDRTNKRAYLSILK